MLHSTGEAWQSVVMPMSTPFYFFLGSLAYLFPDVAVGIAVALIAMRILLK